jgi:hypothetical protein
MKNRRVLLGEILSKLVGAIFWSLGFGGKRRVRSIEKIDLSASHWIEKGRKKGRFRVWH